ncbi:MAG: DUF2905 domain-containing protein [Chloroflexi bacterium]|nr:DUF2905 domain-containing protein [Chloroflexota bacterium]
MGIAGLGKLLIVLGAVVLMVGLLLLLFGEKFSALGRLPGDIAIRKGNVSIYFPVVTFLLISVLLTIVVNIIIRLLGK